MIATPQRQELEYDFSNNVRIFTEMFSDRQDSGINRVLRQGEAQEELRDGLVCGLIVGRGIPVKLR
jgi:hypothetical protein